MRKFLLAAVLLLAVLPAHATIVLVQHTNKDCASAATCVLAYSSSPTANNLLIAVARGGNNVSLGFSDTIVNTWTKGGFQQIASFGCLQIAWTVNTSTAADSVTITPDASNTVRMAIYEYSGAATSSPLDAENNTQFGTSAASAATAILPAANNELVIGATAINSGRTMTAGTNFTIEDAVPAGANKLSVEDWVQTTATSTTAPQTLASSDDWMAAIAVFKVAGAGATPKTTVGGKNVIGGKVVIQ